MTVKHVRSLWNTDLSKVTVAVYVLLLVTILQLVVLNVEPESLHDAGPCLRVHTQQTGQTGIEFVLRGLRTGRKQLVKAENTSPPVPSGGYAEVPDDPA